MDFKSRKIYVWLISFAAVLVVYLLTSLNQTAKINIDTDIKSADTDFIEDVNDEFGSEIGMIGDVGLESIRKAKYTHLNERKEIDREFGFEKLLYEEGDRWEIEKPYMNVLRHNFTCYITADNGNVQVETAVGRPIPKDATLTGNVVIHILPKNNSSIKESFIYLDDIIFLSEKSSFSTEGPIKFTSPDADMVGRGMELVYNDELGRLESLKITHLESLNLRIAAAAEQSENETVNISQSAKEEESPQIESQAKQTMQIGGGYRCLLRKNVVINTDEQAIFANEISISNIQENKTRPEQSRRNTKTTNEQQENSDRPSQFPANSEQQFVNVSVTCDDGIFVMPMDAIYKTEIIDSETDYKPVKSKQLKTTLVAEKINYCASTGDVVASERSEITFYANGIMGNAEETAVPVTITASKKAEFMPRQNKVVFEGDSSCSVSFLDDSGIWQKHMLLAPKITADLFENKSNSKTALIGGIKHLTANGKVVRLATIKKDGEELLGGIELKCTQFDYDTAEGLFVATGPGIIKVDNSKILPSGKAKSKFSLQKPCYAIVRNFETLTYASQSNQIIADAKNQGIFIDYIPVINGQYGRHVLATASHIEALLCKTSNNRSELSSLAATGGVTYEEEARKKVWGTGKAIQFAGSGLLYEADKSMIKAWADESKRCLLNGAVVDGIEYNLKSGRVKTKLVSPGVLQVE
ncbi:MAG: hypothetical protein KAI59_00490 [Planctomycetes bacterium]|nr:hypothetical protein [Planctomycetota bacterium]